MSLARRCALNAGEFAARDQRMAPGHTGEVRMTHQVKYRFTRDEVRELGERLARRASDVYTLREAQKETNAKLKADIQSAEGDVAEIARKINEGYEMRDMECRVEYHIPRQGVKSIIRADTGEVVREEVMTPQEMQASFVFDPEGKKPQ
jgi:uncharacterized FlaG/YvyC family protein